VFSTLGGSIPAPEWVLQACKLLGREKLETTSIYTETSIEALKDVHSRTHPAEQPPAEQNPEDQDPPEQGSDKQDPDEQDPDEQDPDEQDPDEQDPDEQDPESR